MSTITCTPISNWVYEKGRTLRLVRSGNVFAAGMELDDSGVLVRFCNKRDSGTLYLYPGAAENDLDALLVADRPTRHVKDALRNVFDVERVERDEVFRHPLEDTWALCRSCDMLIDPSWPTGIDLRCPSCGERPIQDVEVDRCPACKTYIRSHGGVVPWDRRCLAAAATDDRLS